MNKQALFQQIRKKSSFLCVGLDPAINKIPRHLLKETDPIFEFNKQIIDHTAKFAVAYKPNIAFYESMGPKGWESLQKTLDYIPNDIFTIADAKRGDIGNTSNLYAKTFFELMDFDAITITPYMGMDSIMPFLEFKDKWVILLALTSNDGNKDFQLFKNASGKSLYQEVITKSQSWGTEDNLMYVIGATRGDKIETARKLAPDHFFLVPGVGAQGGSLEEVARFGMNASCGLLVNSSRGIIYASSDENFGKAARQESQKLQKEMEKFLELYCY
ncbi:MAG: orotidine-5'-phosphate decarboxylase [Anditalea sp.]